MGHPHHRAREPRVRDEEEVHRRRPEEVLPRPQHAGRKIAQVEVQVSRSANRLLAQVRVGRLAEGVRHSLAGLAEDPDRGRLQESDLEDQGPVLRVELATARRGPIAILRGADGEVRGHAGGNGDAGEPECVGLRDRAPGVDRAACP
jgi:hypothetical protein